jgi:hypothetical protein
MSRGALRVSAIALGAAAFALLSPLSAASAATLVHHYPAHGVHRRVAHVHGRLYVHRYAHGNAHHYAYGYGYNPAPAAAAGVIGGILGGLGAYPYDCSSYYYGSYGCPAYYDWGDDYWPYYGYGYGPYYGGYGAYGGYGRYGHGRIAGGHFNGGGSHFAGGNFGHVGGFGGGHFGGGFGGGHFGGGAHFH